MISDIVIQWLTLIPTAAFLIFFGYWALFRTDRLIKYYDDKSKIKPGSLLDRMRLAKPKQRFWIKINGAVLLVLGPALIVLLIWDTIYNR